MLSCRTVKGPLIFVSVLMHRETNLQVENEETIEAQSARTPKRCWTESNSAFSFGARISFAGATSGAAFSPPRSRLIPSSPFSSFLSIDRRWRAAACIAVRAYPVGVRKKRPLHSAFADRAVGKTVGSSPTSKMQKRECGWMRCAGRWIGVRGAAGAARSGSEGRGYAPALTSRSAAGMCIPVRFAGTTVPEVAAFASDVSFTFA